MSSEYNNILLEIYENYLAEYKRNGYHPHPANLLAMLLLPEKDTFEPLKVCEGVFYQTYQDKIDDKINQVITDFHITREELLAFIESEDILTDDDSFEEDKIWFVFAEGFGIIHWEMMYRPWKTSYQMYASMEHKSTLYRMTEEGLEEYLPDQQKKKILVYS